MRERRSNSSMTLHIVGVSYFRSSSRSATVMAGRAMVHLVGHGGFQSRLWYVVARTETCRRLSTRRKKNPMPSIDNARHGTTILIDYQLNEGDELQRLTGCANGVAN